MEEEWKEIYEVKSNSKTHLKGDKYYVSNYGRVKYNNLILEMGEGLYLSDNNLRIYGCPLPENTFHRMIYKLFVGDILYKTHQIHHKDFNHLNNAVDNLMQVTPREHGKLHASKYSLDKTTENKKMMDDLSDNIRLLKWTSKNFFEEYTKERLDVIIEKKEKEKQELKEQKKQQREQQRKQYIEDKLNNGYKLSKTGALYNPEITRKMHTYHTEESHKKISNTIKERYKNDPNYRKNVCKNRGMICINNGIKNKYIDSSELSKYIADGWVKGRRTKMK